MVGHPLGGGISLTARKFGYAADHVRRVECVTADGRPHEVTADSDPAPLWALRGGRDDFSLVTGLEARLVPVSRLHGGRLPVRRRRGGRARPERVPAPDGDGPRGDAPSLALVPLPDTPSPRTTPEFSSG